MNYLSLTCSLEFYFSFNAVRNVSLNSTSTSEIDSDLGFHNDDCSFPTLEDVLHRVNVHVGLNIEVKYPTEKLVLNCLIYNTV